MFKGEDSVNIVSKLADEDLYGAIEDALSRLGQVSVSDRGSIEISSGKFGNFATEVELAGKVRKRRREGDYSVGIDYSVKPSGLCWVIAILGFLFCLIGPLILIMPLMAKGEVANSIKKALGDLEVDLDE